MLRHPKSIFKMLFGCCCVDLFFPALRIKPGDQHGIAPSLELGHELYAWIAAKRFVEHVLRLEVEFVHQMKPGFSSRFTADSANLAPL